MSQVNNYAIVTSGTVTNIVVWDGVSEWVTPQGTQAILVPEGQSVGLGFTYDGTTFSEPVVVTG